jgi:hypothetical protein
VRVHHTFHFAYADGTPFKPIGTTIYNWIDTPEELQEETLRTLAASPFNKARMLITQQPTPYRKEFAPPRWPYAGQPPRDWDFTRFNPEFFRHYEKRLGQLRDLGIEADLILFNPYGKFGFETLDAAGDERFVRYVVARFGAFRNVWWSLANEYDFLRTKTEADWDRLGQLVQACDPHHRLRSIHNGHLLYDHRQPWVTHVSVQDGHAVEAPGSAKIYRDAFRKPVVFDEIKYEGDAKFRWADLSGFDLVHRFWSGTMAGTYVGHGDYFNTVDEDTWTSFGGRILGTSVPRLAFLRQILEEGPAQGLDPVDGWMDPGMVGVAGEYYLHYFGRQSPQSWPFQLFRTGLTEGMRFNVEIIDVWEMTITPVTGEFITKREDRYHFVATDGRSVTLPGSVIGVIFGNRDFFPDKLVSEARADIVQLFRDSGIEAIMLDPAETKLGGVETHDDARRCAELFRRHRDSIAGVLVCLPNFGDEKGVADTLKLSGLNVPVLVQGYPDDLDKLDVIRRRDAFCGKISVCNNLRQAGIRYSLTTKHVVHPLRSLFRRDLRAFSPSAGWCAVCAGAHRCRRRAPGAFNTVRYSRRSSSGTGSASPPSTSPRSSAPPPSSATRTPGSRARSTRSGLRQRHRGSSGEARADGRLGVVLDDFVARHHLDATAIQCWTSVQQNHGCNVCTSMSMMSEQFLPSACEVDVTGVLTMYAMQLASQTPSALVDWNNNYGTDPTTSACSFTAATGRSRFPARHQGAQRPDPRFDPRGGKHVGRARRSHARESAHLRSDHDR